MSGEYRSAGVIAPIACGEWNKDAFYFQLNIVSILGDSWICRKACAGIEPNYKNTEYWQPCGSSELVRQYVEEAKKYAEEAATIAGATIMTGATESSDGVSGFVPIPRAGEQNYFLRGDGTWAIMETMSHLNGFSFQIRNGRPYIIYKVDEDYEIDENGNPIHVISNIDVDALIENIYDNDETNNAEPSDVIDDIIQQIYN